MLVPVPTYPGSSTVKWVEESTGSSITISDLFRLRDELIRARMKNVREFQDQNGERVAYRSDAEMAAAIIAINREIQNHDRRAPSAVLFRTSKGL